MIDLSISYEIYYFKYFKENVFYLNKIKIRVSVPMLGFYGCLGNSRGKIIKDRLDSSKKNTRYVI